jgi:hypothetical protein
MSEAPPTTRVRCEGDRLRKGVLIPSARIDERTSARDCESHLTPKSAATSGHDDRLAVESILLAQRHVLLGLRRKMPTF